MTTKESKQSLENDHDAPVPGALTDGFHLLIDAMKLNDLNTIYGVPGIPITDFGRMAQAAGMRVISFRHEQNAGNAAAIAGFLTKKPGVPPALSLTSACLHSVQLQPPVSTELPGNLLP